MSKITFASVLALADREHTASQEGSVKVGTMLFDLASTCKDRDTFLGLCSEAETNRKANLTKIANEKEISKEDRKTMLKLPHCWVQAKSNISVMWEKGHEPNDFESYSALKAKKTEMGRGKKKGTSGSGEGVAMVPGTEGTTVIQVPNLFGVLFGDLIKRAVNLPQAYQEKLANDVEQYIGMYEKEISQPTETTEAANDDVTEADVNALEEAQIAQVTQAA